MKILSIHFNHDASIAYSPAPGEYKIYELERWKKQKHYDISNDDSQPPNDLFEEIVKFIVENIQKDYAHKYDDLFKLDYLLFDSLYPAWCWWQEDEYSINSKWKKFEAAILRYFYVDRKNFHFLDHHECHALGAFYQSPFKEALVITMDGMGVRPDNTLTFATISLIDRHTHKLHKLAESNECRDYFDLSGKWYRELFYFCKTFDGEKYKNIDICGKAMGAAGYGMPHYSFMKDFEEVYNKRDHTYLARFNHWFGTHGEYYINEINPVYKIVKKYFGDKIDGFDDLRIDDWQTEADFIHSIQIMFENEFDKFIEPFVYRYNLPIVLAGGAALNVLNNTRIKNKYKLPVFVPCNPNDCGLSLGHIFKFTKPSEKVDVRFNGWDLFDRNKLDFYIDKRKPTKPSITEISELLRDGKIIGVVKGRTECGPRALGNRSIICDPSYPNMKEILNAKVKFREWFRPFAPMILQDDITRYFEWDDMEAPHMSFATKVKCEYREQLQAITHIDQTARIQTVTKEDNPFYYELLKELKNTGLSVILNTSFNIKGNPILNSIEDALQVLDTTELDYVLIEGYLFEKNN